MGGVAADRDHAALHVGVEGSSVGEAASGPEDHLRGLSGELAPYSPQLDPIGRVWLHLRERHLSHWLFDTYDAILDACYAAWNVLLANTGRIASLGSAV